MYPTNVQGVPVTNCAVVVEITFPLPSTARKLVASPSPSVSWEIVVEARTVVPVAVKLLFPRFTAPVAPV